MRIYSDEEGFNIERVISGLSRAHSEVNVTQTQVTVTKCYEKAKAATGPCEKSFTTFKCFFEKYGDKLKDGFVPKDKKEEPTTETTNTNA